VYKCSICGNIVELIHSGGGKLVCCGKEMEPMKMLGISDEGNEKHVPVVEKVRGGITVKVSSTPHPMQDDHYIMWIEVWANGGSYRKHLNVADAPEATFAGIKPEDIEMVREYCSVHGLWKA